MQYNVVPVLGVGFMKRGSPRGVRGGVPTGSRGPPGWKWVSRGRERQAGSAADAGAAASALHVLSPKMEYDVETRGLLSPAGCRYDISVGGKGGKGLGRRVFKHMQK
jgi:hypothetical protein